MKKKPKKPLRFWERQSAANADGTAAGSISVFRRRTLKAVSLTGLPDIFKPVTFVVQLVYTFISSNDYSIKSITMKKLLIVIYFLMAAFSSIASVRNINEKLVQAFRETYPNAVQVSWKEYPETYAVYFAEEGIKATIIFKKDGSFVSSTRYYGEEYLPYYLVAAIREKYPEKKIYGVTEMSSPSGVDYYIKLEDANKWVTLKIDSEGNIRLVEKFKKA
jgi:hypothetical protein